jgi:glycine/D-amino acid oxidase-like deaminating enzyme
MEENGLDFYGFPMLNPEIFGDPTGLKIALHYPGKKIEDADLIDRETSESDEKILIEFMKKYIPGAYKRTTELKTCLYTYSPDHNFVIDYLPDYDGNIIFAGGFSGHGFKFASAVGEILSDLAATGKTTQSVEFLSAKRFT